jgi:hypothetical protein
VVERETGFDDGVVGRVKREKSDDECIVIKDEPES